VSCAAAREISFCRLYQTLRGDTSITSSELECFEFQSLQAGRAFNVAHTVLAGIAALALVGMNANFAQCKGIAIASLSLAGAFGGTVWVQGHAVVWLSGCLGA
jgi:hypothetical protein